MKSVLSTLACLLLLSACSAGEPLPVPIENDTVGKINLEVLSVIVLDKTTAPPSSSPYLSNNFQPTLASAMRKWAKDNLIATGQTGQAIVIIRDGSLRSEVIPHADSWLKREQASKYVGHASLDIDVAGRDKQGKVSAEASRFETLPEDPSTDERHVAYTKLLNGIMRDLSKNIRAGVSQHLQNFVTYGAPAGMNSSAAPEINLSSPSDPSSLMSAEKTPAVPSPLSPTTSVPSAIATPVSPAIELPPPGSE